ncbi:unnamed protein product, partial [Rotaria sordida]
ENKENENKHQLRSRTKSDSTLKHRQTSPILPRPKRSHERKRHTESLTASITQLGFTYQRTSQVKIPLDSNSFIASRARYFETMKQLRDSHAQIYFQDESWINLGDVRKNIWVYEGKGPLHQNDGKGDEAKIAIVLDNASWHNVLTLDRSVKAELLELALANAPPKEYITDQATEQFRVQIVRLPHRHCCLNPIELSWNNLKQYIRDNNVTFKANDVYNLILDLMGGLDTELATSYFKHVEKVEQTFTDADSFLEEDIEPNLVEEETMTEEEDDDDDDE